MIEKHEQEIAQRFSPSCETGHVGLGLPRYTLRDVEAGLVSGRFVAVAADLPESLIEAILRAGARGVLVYSRGSDQPDCIYWLAPEPHDLTEPHDLPVAVVQFDGRTHVVSIESARRMHAEGAGEVLGLIEESGDEHEWVLDPAWAVVRDWIERHRPDLLAGFDQRRREALERRALEREKMR